MTDCNPDSKGSGKLRNLDIVGARALMVAPKGSISRAAAEGESTETEFLKQLDDGSWVKVRMADETGDEIKRTPPDEIYDATDDWLFIAWGAWENFGEQPPQTPKWDFKAEEAYLVNKSNGDAYDVSQVGMPRLRIANSHKFSDVFTDKNGNIYYFTGTGSQDYKTSDVPDGIVKITVGKTQATAEWVVSSDLYVVSNFAVDNDGNILYFASQGTRIRTVNGVTIPLDDKKPTSYGLLMTGYDGHIYGNFDSKNYTDGKFSKVEITGNTINDIIISPVEFEIVNSEYTSDPDTVVPEQFVPQQTGLIFPEKMVYLSSGGEKIFIIYKNSNTPKCVFLEKYRTRNTAIVGSKVLDWGMDGSGMFSISIVDPETGKTITKELSDNIISITVGSKDIFVRAGKSIFTADPETLNMTTKVTATDYDLIYRFEVTPNDVIIINALTFDGKKILANIYPDGRKEILSESMDETKTLVLVKVR